MFDPLWWKELRFRFNYGRFSVSLALRLLPETGGKSHPPDSTHPDLADGIGVLPLTG
jgi:hypothetical protein